MYCLRNILVKLSSIFKLKSMTPQESVAAYETWCAANKSFRIGWAEGASSRTLTVHMKETVAEKIVEILPVSNEGVPVTINKVASTLSFDGYKEWLKYQ